MIKQISTIEKLIAEQCQNGVEFKAIGEIARIKHGKDYKKLGAGSVSRFSPSGDRSKKRESILDKLTRFFERFFDISGSLENPLQPHLKVKS